MGVSTVYIHLLKDKVFKVLNIRIVFKHRQAFIMTNNKASSGLWKMLYIPIFILTTNGIIGCVMSGTPTAETLNSDGSIPFLDILISP